MSAGSNCFESVVDRVPFTVDAVPGLAFSIRPDGFVDALNRRWLEYTGLRHDAGVGSGWQASLFEPDASELLNACLKSLRTGEPSEAEARLRRFDGECRWFLFRAEPLQSEAGEIVRIVVQATDIEDRKSAETWLASERGLLELIAKGAHLSQTLEALARTVEAMFRGERVSILLVDSKGTRLKHAAGPTLPEEYAKFLDNPIDPEVGPCAAVAALGEQVIVDDIVSETRWPSFRALMRTYGIRSVWSTPITSSAGSVVGTFAIYSREPSTPTPLQKRQLEQFTNLASIAIEHEIATDALRAEALLIGQRRLLEMLAGGDSMPQVLEAICHLVESTASGCYCSVVLVDSSGTHLEHGAAPSLPGSFITSIVGRPVNLDSGPCAMAACLNEQVVATDLTSETRWETDQWCPMALAHGLRACWSTPIPSSTGKVLGAFALYYDEPKGPTSLHQSLIEQLTHIASIAIERVQTDAARRLSEERHAIAMEAAGEGHWDWDIARNRFYASPLLLRICGLPPDSTFANREEFHARFPFHPEDRPKWVRALEANFAGTTEKLEMEMRILCGGETRWVHVTGLCRRDASRAPVRFAGSVTDVTARKHVEEELRARQEMLDLAQKAARAVAFEWLIGVADGQNRWSPGLEAMYGLEPATYDGTYETWKKLVHPEDWPSVRTAIKRAQQTGDVSAEYRVIHKGGAIRWLQAKGRMFFDGEGNPARMVGFMLDVTERRVAEEELRKVEAQLRQAQRLEAMGTLAGGIAHDFNNLLGAILGYGEMALRGAKAGSRLRRDIDSILTAGERGRALVDRILAFSRSGVGERMPVHVQRVVRETLTLVAAKIPSDVRIEERLRAGRSAVLGDPTQIHQVLMNLVTNAAHAMPAGGKLRILLERSQLDAPRTMTVGSLSAGEYIVLKVIDAGTGIAPEIRERIFDPFFTTKEVGVGSGLGLSLVHGIVLGLGGAIDVISTVGEGSTFIVYLPRFGEIRGNRKNARIATSITGGHRERILVVDDEPSLVNLLSETLRELGYCPVGHTSSLAALEAFRASPQEFDALITDESMPGSSGSELIRKIKAIRPAIPTLLVSGYLSNAVLQTAQNAGADDVLRKPIYFREIAATLARLLQSRDGSRNNGGRRIAETNF